VDEHVVKETPKEAPAPVSVPAATSHVPEKRKGGHFLFGSFWDFWLIMTAFCLASDDDDDESGAKRQRQTISTSTRQASQDNGAAAAGISSKTVKVQDLSLFFPFFNHHVELILIS